jgi:ATP synthase protein I
MMTEKSGFSTVRKILLMQVVVIFVTTGGFLILKGESYIIPSFLGGLIAFLPNLYFAYRISLAKGESAKIIVRSFYSGESRKILLTCALFAIVFQVPDIQIFPLMTCFVAVLSVFWFALVLFAQDFEIKSVRKDG